MPAVVLWEPRDPINVGAVIRACMLCEAPELVLVGPRFDDPERVLVAAPHGEDYFANHTRSVQRWEDAVVGRHRVVAFTARVRRDHHGAMRIAEVAARLRDDGLPTAFVFGREDRGLPNEVLDRSDWYVVLEASPRFRSYNLAQAVMVALHRVLEEVVGADGPAADPPRDRASHDELERMMATAEAGLDAIGFFKGDQRANVLRTLRAALLRAEVDRRELATFWALFADLERVGRLGRRVDAPESG